MNNEKELINKYKKLNIPYKYSIDEVDTLYKQKYKAIELGKEHFADLKEDPYVDYSNIIKCYEIRDKLVLSTIFSKEEKQCHLEFIEEIGRFNPEEDFEIEEGRLINVILESTDGKHISSFTLRGRCDTIFFELIVFQGINSQDCKEGNPRFNEYLQSLLKAGYLN